MNPWWVNYAEIVKDKASGSGNGATLGAYMSILGPEVEIIESHTDDFGRTVEKGRANMYAGNLGDGFIGPDEVAVVLSGETNFHTLPSKCIGTNGSAKKESIKAYDAATHWF